MVRVERRNLKHYFKSLFFLDQLKNKNKSNTSGSCESTMAANNIKTTKNQACRIIFCNSSRNRAGQHQIFCFFFYCEKTLRHSAKNTMAAARSTSLSLGSITTGISNCNNNVSNNQWGEIHLFGGNVDCSAHHLATVVRTLCVSLFVACSHTSRGLKASGCSTGAYARAETNANRDAPSSSHEAAKDLYGCVSVNGASRQQQAPVQIAALSRANAHVLGMPLQQVVDAGWRRTSLQTITPHRAKHTFANFKRHKQSPQTVERDRGGSGSNTYKVWMRFFFSTKKNTKFSETLLTGCIDGWWQVSTTRLLARPALDQFTRRLCSAGAPKCFEECAQPIERIALRRVAFCLCVDKKNWLQRQTT